MIMAVRMIRCYQMLSAIYSTLVLHNAYYCHHHVMLFVLFIADYSQLYIYRVIPQLHMDHNTHIMIYYHELNPNNSEMTHTVTEFHNSSA